MIVNSYHDIKVFLMCLLCGIAIGILFDIFRAIRKNIKFKTGVISFQDAFYCACVFFMFTKTIDITNNGELRWFEFVGAFFGVIIYFLWLSKLLLGIFTSILGVAVKFFAWIKKTINKLCVLIVRPFLLVTNCLKTVSRAVYRHIRQFFIKKASKKA